MLDWEKATSVFLWNLEIDGKSARTIDWFKTHLTLFIRFHKDNGLDCPSPTLCEPEHIKLYLSHLARKKISPISLLTYFNAISCFFS